MMSENGISTDPAKIETIRVWPILWKQVRNFLDFVLIRKFVKGLSFVVKSLNFLIGNLKKSSCLCDDERCQEVFKKLKLNLVSSPYSILSYRGWKVQFQHWRPESWHRCGIVSVAEWERKSSYYNLLLILIFFLFLL